ERPFYRPPAWRGLAMKYIKNKNQFPKVGFKVLLWIGLLYASLGQALGQVPETTTKPSETATKPSETAAKPSETAAESSETAETAELEEEKIEETKPFAILYTNNIFDPNRKPDRPGRKRPDPKPEPQIDAFTLIGLMAYTAPKSSAPKSSETDRRIAVLSGSSSEYSGVFKRNDQIDSLELISLSDKTVKFAEGETTFSVDIGTGLRRVDGGAWKESSERVRTASRSGSSRSQYSSRGTARSDDNKDSTKDSEDKGGESDGATDSEAELLRKMMERRRQEVGE
ncbi:uncharacterized protein METZ01_LOCUS220927, partial [marine metagenome]